MADNQDDSFSASKAEVFEALGHPTRIRLLQTLSDKPLPFSELKRAAGLESNGLLTFHLGKLSGLVRLNPEGAYALTDEGREALRIVEASKNQSQERPFQGPSIHVPHPKTVLAVFVVVLVILASASAIEYNQIQGLDSRIQTTQSAITGTTTVTTGIPTTVTDIITTAVTTTIAATSPPLVEEATATCTKYPGNPVLVSGSGDSWDNTGVESPFVMSNGSNFVMFYTGTYNNVTSEIGLATSTDGVQWTKYASPVLEVGEQGSWDSSTVYFPSVIWNGTEYLIYYTGFNLTNSASIGVAFSKDLIHWQKYAENPILKPGPGIYDNVSITSHSVMYDPPLYKMWYSGRYSGNYTHSIGYATSTDGVHWTKYAGNPVMTRSTTHDSYILGPWGPSVVKIDDEYFAAFETDGLVSSATSSDGIHWTASVRPLLLYSNQTSSFDFVIETPSILLVNSALYLWYTGFSDVTSRPFPTIGFAFCSPSPLVVTTTITSFSSSVTTSTIVQTSVSTTTVVSQSTAIQTSTTTKEVPTAALTLYQVSTAILAILLIIAAAIIFARRRSK